jgi:glycogen debranching enzyme
MEDFAGRFNEPKAKREYGAMADQARASFNKLFWNEEAGCLYDVINGETRDASIRPNQVIAISLANTMVPEDRAASILSVVERELLTPRGLRTLSPSDPNYIGRYGGGPRSRDGAYHQGTVWPWLIGPYITAYSKTFGRKEGRRFVAMWLKNFQQHLEEAGLGQVSEIFDGDAPHTPCGCVAQAWSVGELLRAIVEDVEQRHTEAARAA